MPSCFRVNHTPLTPDPKEVIDGVNHKSLTPDPREVIDLNILLINNI